ncbi:phosphate/phosphite/phosphonate ABC transporter substrate-binding protein [Alkalisalibacterium limincola]|uniref:Phosphate/phosphite/phosphonate ABC transporter substrate-binding protein n=1 Tax=Alkalisalibacterium limincola TaxID=2699169 RepID=A0A5C8KLP5_9GAMM|nr:phosphate/phosphite/phosphonate ABC transporter substrate-binding protein [Alkalisalibacterium limincola]TXK60511.1 phosphate/phosphite/phosphonate ABC transporter substrate-binding protein [Alkalisalibacterium limincola]
MWSRFAGSASGLLLVMVLSTGLAVPAVSLAQERDVLVLGRISDDPRRHYDQLQPLLDYLVPRLHDVGIREGRILMARDVQQMQAHLRRGRVDWVTETPAMAVTLIDRANARVLLATERTGVASYRTIFLARRDSNVHDLGSLAGRAVAFQSPASTSAYTVPAMMLLEAGLQPEVMISPLDTPARDSVGYVFARTEFNIATWVEKGIVDAGAVSNLDWAEILVRAPALEDSLHIVAESGPVPRGLELVREGIDPQVERRLRELLLAAADDPEAGPALRAFFDTTRFIEVDAEIRQQLEALRAGIQRIRDEME